MTRPLSFYVFLLQDSPDMVPDLPFNIYDVEGRALAVAKWIKQRLWDRDEPRRCHHHRRVCTQLPRALSVVLPPVNAKLEAD